LQVLLASTVAASALQYATPEFWSKQSRPLAIALLPPHAEFIKAKAVMTDEMVKESEALENEAALALKAGLVERGYAARILTVADLGQSPELRDLAKRLGDRYDEEWSKIVRKPRKVRERRYSAGEDVAKMCSLLKVDGIAFARIQAVGVTGGKTALVAILSLGNAWAQSYARMDLSVLSSRDGTVEGYFVGSRACTLKGLTEKPASIMKKVTDVALRKYPGKDETRIVKNEAGEAEKGAGEEDEVSEEKAIEDFEVLLGGKPPAGEQKAAEPSQTSPAQAP
jgi:hypothetical protein